VSVNINSTVFKPFQASIAFRNKGSDPETKEANNFILLRYNVARQRNSLAMWALFNLYHVTIFINVK
jgi:hypothetical protein